MPLVEKCWYEHMNNIVERTFVDSFKARVTELEDQFLFKVFTALCSRSQNLMMWVEWLERLKWHATGLEVSHTHFSTYFISVWTHCLERLLAIIQFTLIKRHSSQCPVNSNVNHPFFYLRVCFFFTTLTLAFFASLLRGHFYDCYCPCFSLDVMMRLSRRKRVQFVMLIEFHNASN